DRVDVGALVATVEGAGLEGRLAPDLGVEAGVGLGEDGVEAGRHRVGEHEGAGHEADAERDGHGGEERSELVAPDVGESDLEHAGPQAPSDLSRSSTDSSVGPSIWSTMRPSARNRTRSA